MGSKHWLSASVFLRERFVVVVVVVAVALLKDLA